MADDLRVGQRVKAFSKRWTPDGWEPIEQLATVIDPCVKDDPDYTGDVELKIEGELSRVFVPRASVEPIEEVSERRMNLCKSTCEVRDARWSIHIDAGDDPCNLVVKHRQYGDFYDWPEAVLGPDCRGGVCPAADRAYTMQDESHFRTRGAALKAAHDFLRRFGAGEVEYLEWDVDSQSMVVVGHQERNRIIGWYKHWDDKPDPIAPFYQPETP